MKNLFMLSMIVLTITSCKTQPSPSNPFDGKYQTIGLTPPIQFEIRDGTFFIGETTISYISGTVNRAVFKFSNPTKTGYELNKLSNNQLFSSEATFNTPKEAEESGDPTDLIAEKI